RRRPYAPSAAATCGRAARACWPRRRRGEDGGGGGMRIFLTGFMGAGETTVGGRLAALLGLPFIDLDQEIERQAGATVREIVEGQGEAVFRRLELGGLEGGLGEGGGGGAPRG